jgi:sister-chromatid-cohesion protein PDS5
MCLAQFLDILSLLIRVVEVRLPGKQDTLLLKDYPAAYNMAKAICQACPERMTSHISQ